MTELTAKKVRDIITDCLYRPEEVPDHVPPADAVIVDGVLGKFGLHPKRLASHRQEVVDMLSQLPSEFSEGGGWSFLNMCMRKDGQQWGEHPTMNDLVVLGIGLGLVEFCASRDLWHVLPGGMPYLRIKS